MVKARNDFLNTADWLFLQQQRFTEAEYIQLVQAAAIAEEYYRNKTMQSTELLLHALRCANTVAELNIFYDAVIAALLSFLPAILTNWQSILHIFSKELIVFIEDIHKTHQTYTLHTFTFADKSLKQRAQIEIMRQMLLAMVHDIRVILIILVQRGDLMLHLDNCTHSQQQHFAFETSEIFAPLANRLGLWQIKWELEDLSLKYLDPAAYKAIATALDETRISRLRYIDQMKVILSQQLKTQAISNFHISGRAKHIYSIWKKMCKKNADFEHLYDIRALRILVDTIAECYTVLGLIHTQYTPITGEFDDYISNPKPNLYQSLHTCVLGPENLAVEIQIRTFAMHEHAEYGVAAHWRYKEGGETNTLLEEKITWVRQLLDWKSEDSATQPHNLFTNDVFNDMIYVVTPHGLVVALTQGATAIDFAYAVHSSIGHRCRGAKINGKMIPLSTVLSNGQCVEILTVKEGNPNINWLHDGWVHTTKAIAHIRRYIRQQNNEEFYLDGKNIFDKEYAKLPQSQRPKIIEIVEQLKQIDERSLYIALAKNEISVAAIQSAFKVFAPHQAQTIVSTTKIIKHSPHDILVAGVSGIKIGLAKCCNPIPGDAILGFITSAQIVSIHRYNCRIITHHSLRFPQKIMQVEWSNTAQSKPYNATLSIFAQDRAALILDITQLCAKLKANVMEMHSSCHNNQAIITITVQMRDISVEIQHLISKLRAIKNITSITRK